MLLHLYALPKKKRLASVREVLRVILTAIWDFDLGEIRSLLLGQSSVDDEGVIMQITVNYSG